MNHVHVSALTGVTILCYVLIIGFLLRALAAALAQRGNVFGKALGGIY